MKKRASSHSWLPCCAAALLLITARALPSSAEQIFSSANETIPITLNISADPGGAVRQAAAFYEKGAAEYDAGNWAGAKENFNLALKALAGVDEGGLGKEPGQEYSRLLGSVCLFQVRVRNIIYGFTVNVDDMGSETCPFPVVFNEKVEKWLEKFVSAERDYFAKKLYEAGKYSGSMKEIFRERGLPPDLIYVALVESGFNPYAYSRAHAVGMWQFMLGTSVLFGLDRNHWVDERRDVEKSTRAAAKFLKSLYGQFGSWTLALAAYNAGPNRVAQAIRDQGTRDFWVLALPAETRDFVPKILAAIMIARNPESYGFSGESCDINAFETVQVNGCVDMGTVVKCCGASLEQVMDLNPELTRMCTPETDGVYNLRVPKGTAQAFLENFRSLPEEHKYLSKEEIARRKGYWAAYSVKSGDTLNKIAKKFGASVEKIKQWNPSVKRMKYLQVGCKLRVFQK